MKRLNTYLLTHYPLLWNLRVHIFWPLILGLHLLFFLWGYGNAALSKRQSYMRLGPDEEVLTLAVLLGMLLTFFWLALYFRNNAFKSFLPLKRGRLALEALFVFATGFGIISIAESYRTGSCMQLRQRGRGVNIESERATLRLARHFLPFHLSQFSRFQPCYDEPVQAAAAMRDSAGVAADTFSYLNFCDYGAGTYEENGTTKQRPSAISLRARSWLLHRQQDSVLHALQRYLALLMKYGGRYSFDPRAHVASIFSHPRFELQYVIRSVYQESNSNAVVDADGSLDATTVVTETDITTGKQAPQLLYDGRPAFIEDSRADEMLIAIEWARRGSYRYEISIGLLYGALALTILIMGFRLTELRTWSFALIGAVLWVIVIGLMIAVTQGANGALVAVLVLELVFTGVAVATINEQGSRRLAGLCTLWSLYAAPLVVPMLWLLLEELTRPYAYGPDGVKPSAFHTFLNTYGSWIFAVNIGISLLLILVFYIPLARKWQAIPEE